MTQNTTRKKQPDEETKEETTEIKKKPAAAPKMKPIDKMLSFSTSGVLLIFVITENIVLTNMLLYTCINTLKLTEMQGLDQTG